MALDGIFLNTVKHELQNWIGGRIDRIYQPMSQEIVILLRRPRENIKLLISAASNCARIHFTKNSFSNPKTPPMFCMLLRKHLENGRLNSVSQEGFDRVINLEFETRNQIGNKVVYILAVEIMGRHSNIILYNKETGIIVDSIKRVNSSMSKQRQILPKEKYLSVPSQKKLNILNCDSAFIVNKVTEKKETFLDKALVSTIQGISPLVSRELSIGIENKILGDFDLNDKTILFDKIQTLKQKIKKREYVFVVLMNENKPKEFSYIDINQYGSAYGKKIFSTASELLDFFYSERDHIERLHQHSDNIINYLKGKISRAKRTLDVRIKELNNLSNKDEYRKYGDLLSANLSRIKKGQTVVKVENFYDSNKIISLEIDPSKTPYQNVQKYYKIYKKSKNARVKLNELILESQNEIEFLESELDLICRTTSEDEINGIMEELYEQNYYFKSTKNKSKSKNKMKNKIRPFKFVSSDGFVIWCGKNSKQNDALTTKKANKDDIWLHTHNIHGSHVIIVTDGKKVPDRTLEEAAIIAAYNSKGKNGSKIPVDYTEIKNVHKPNGAKPGMVIFEKQKTILVDPDSEVVKNLLVDY